MSRTCFVCLGFPKVSLLASRDSCSCEVLNDPCGVLSLFGLYWRDHRDALCAELDASRTIDSGDELSRIRDFYFSEIERSFIGNSAREKCESLFDRIRRVYIESSKDADLIAFYDSPKTTFFIPDELHTRNPFIDISLSNVLGQCLSSDNLIVLKNETSICVPRRENEAA